MRVLSLLFFSLVATGCVNEMSAPPTVTLNARTIRSAHAVAYRTLYSFKVAADGFRPTTALVAEGNLFYGTTTSGGYAASGPCDSCGAVYSITPDGSETVIYKFPGPPGGSGPEGNLIVANSVLYGTTFYGGRAKPPRTCAPILKGCGVVFSVDRNGTESILHSFKGGDDGENPDGGVANGKFPARSGYYGTTATSKLPNVFGTIFFIGADGEQVLHRFAGPPGDGQFPIGSPAIIKDKLYGVTATGGAHNLGAVFVLSIKRNEQPTEKILHDFSGGSDGSDPTGGLAEINGVLYGVASAGGPGASGVLFSITVAGNYHIVHAFRGSTGGDGAEPQSPPILVYGTTLYGTTYRGGTHGQGTVYKIDQHGNESVLHNFGPPPDGVHPKASLLWHDAALYGTTVHGGQGDAVGTVFKLTPP